MFEMVLDASDAEIGSLCAFDVRVTYKVTA
jgi:hypothetical protein